MGKKKVTLIHNPNAGTDDHEKEKLLRAINASGYRCVYRSTKEKKWKRVSADTDIVAVAGGDGTVKKTMQLLCGEKNLSDQVRLGILPLGTANNIAATLGIRGHEEKLPLRWGKKSLLFNTGIAEWGNEKSVIVESVGVGLLPAHIHSMMLRPEKKDGRKETIRAAQTNILRLCASFRTFYTEITVDGKKVTGDLLLAEVMNIRRAGPSVEFAPEASVSDGLFDVVVAMEEHRGMLADYLYDLISGRKSKLELPVLQGKRIEILAHFGQVHIDDTLYELPRPVLLKVEMSDKRIECFV